MTPKNKKHQRNHNQEIPFAEFSPRKADAAELEAVRTYLNRKSSYLLGYTVAVGCHFSQTGVHVANAWRDGSTCEHFEPHTVLKTGDILALVEQSVGRIVCIDDLSPVPDDAIRWYSDFLQAANQAASAGALLLFRSTRTLLPTLLPACRPGKRGWEKPDQLARGAAYEALARFYELDEAQYVAAERDGMLGPSGSGPARAQWVQPLWAGEAAE